MAQVDQASTSALITAQNAFVQAGGGAGGIIPHGGPRIATPGNGGMPEDWRPMQSDGVQSPVWGNAGPNGASSGGSNSTAQGVQGMINSVSNLFSSLIGNLNNMISQMGNASTEQAAEGPASQTVSNATFSSVGDPHLGETGSAYDANGNPVSMNTHFDSMQSHDNLISSQDFDGGYRVSTSVTQPNANGITQNQSATVHTNNNQNTVTMNNDGSFAISDNGQNVALAPGQSTTLSAGEQVTRNANGSLTVSEQNGNQGSISTTMQSNGSGGVDVTTNVQNATVGGDIANAAASTTPSAATNPPQQRGIMPIAAPIMLPIAAPVDPPQGGGLNIGSIIGSVTDGSGGIFGLAGGLLGIGGSSGSLLGGGSTSGGTSANPLASLGSLLNNGSNSGGLQDGTMLAGGDEATDDLLNLGSVA
jgi:hypothetical protein